MSGISFCLVRCGVQLDSQAVRCYPHMKLNILSIEEPGLTSIQCRDMEFIQTTDAIFPLCILSKHSCSLLAGSIVVTRTCKFLKEQMDRDS